MHNANAKFDKISEDRKHTTVFFGSKDATFLRSVLLMDENEKHNILIFAKNARVIIISGNLIASE